MTADIKRERKIHRQTDIQTDRQTGKISPFLCNQYTCKPNKESCQRQLLMYTTKKSNTSKNVRRIYFCTALFSEKHFPEMLLVFRFAAPSDACARGITANCPHGGSPLGRRVRHCSGIRRWIPDTLDSLPPH